MVEFTLPKNSRVTTGKTWPKPAGAANVKEFKIYRWNPDRPDESVTRIPCSVDGVYSFAVHPDGRTLAAGLSSGAVLLLDAGTGKLIRHHAGHGQNVYDVAFSPDGTAVASTCRDGRVTVRATDTFDELHQLYLPSDARRVLFTPDDRFLVTASYDGEVTLWDRANGYRRAASHHLGRGELTNIQCRPDATQLACGTRSHGLKVWAIRGQDELPTPNTSGCTQSVAYSPDSRWLATARPPSQRTRWA